MQHRPWIYRAVLLVMVVMAPGMGHAALLGDIGPVPPSVTDSRSGLARGAYDDYYTFTADEDVNATITFSVAQDGTTGTLSPGAFNIQLFAASFPVGVPVAMGVSTANPTVSFSADLLMGQIYALRTAFNFNTTLDAAATATTSVTTPSTSVPEPATAAVMVAALAGLGFAGRRRRS